jgi:hypothetical protein
MYVCCFRRAPVAEQPVIQMDEVQADEQLQDINDAAPQQPAGPVVADEMEVDKSITGANPTPQAADEVAEPMDSEPITKSEQIQSNGVEMDQSSEETESQVRRAAN